YRLSPHMPAWAAAIIEQAWLSQQQGFTELAQQAAAGGRVLCR
ncbi:transcriptional regulator, partial [Serratia plymuthica]